MTNPPTDEIERVRDAMISTLILAGKGLGVGDVDKLATAAIAAMNTRRENEVLEKFEGFALSMFRATLSGLESNKSMRWDRALSDHAERCFTEALSDYRAALTNTPVVGEK